MTVTDASLTRSGQLADSDGEFRHILAAAGQVLLGKEQAVRYGLACLIAGGHLLIEDLPGVGKTTLAHLLARLLGLEFQRIQFTSDLLPADVIGVSVYDRNAGNFHFHPGPVFTQLLLADEINRATPKTQSALLEAMEERQVTVDGETRPLPQPFFVIATQNPAHQVGTYPLPESQLDRFLMCISLGYPDADSERNLLSGRDRRQMLDEIQPVADAAALARWREKLDQVHVAGPLLDYVQALLQASRGRDDFQHGLSPRAGLSLLRSARAWALLHGRYQVLPEDVQAVLGPVAGHRLRSGTGLDDGQLLARQLLTSVAVP